MTNNPYVNSNEMQELLWLGASLELISCIIKNCKDGSEYKEKLTNCHSVLESVRNKRFSLLDKKGREQIYKRVRSGFAVVQKHSNIAMSSPTITVDENSLYDLCEAVTEEHCYGCKSNKTKCKIYSILRGLNCPANDPRVSAKECEYAIKKSLTITAQEEAEKSKLNEPCT